MVEKMKGHPSYKWKTQRASLDNQHRYDHITEVQWAYLAGIIDGEGCIHIRSSDHRGKRGIRSVYYCLTIAVSNTSAPMILWLSETFDHGYVVSGGRTVRKNPIWRWLVASEMAEEICRRILPYLTAKKAQAELALSFRETFWGHRARTKEPISDNVQEYRKFCFEQMKALKQQRGTMDLVRTGRES